MSNYIYAILSDLLYSEKLISAGEDEETSGPDMGPDKAV